ncbi:MAG: class I SAM-dependent methyltransferase, partial [Bacteroidia bacterium]
EITKIKPAGLTITYVDISSKMIQLSKKRNMGLNTVEFIEASVEDLSFAEKKYDVILTPFLFDVLSQSTCQHVFKKLTASLKTKGLWFYTDFFLSDKSKYWQKFVLKIMYVFFRFTCKIEATKLPAVEIYFSKYETIFHNTYCKHFIVSKVFRQP